MLVVLVVLVVLVELVVDVEVIEGVVIWLSFVELVVGELILLDDSLEILLDGSLDRLATEEIDACKLFRGCI